MSTVNVQKYDRQLRLWGEHGQQALQDAAVCLINGTATGTELLKNLILPGIGTFTVVDGHNVSGSDAGCNFFLEESCIGRPRAESVTGLLQELNPDVKGNYVNEHPEDLLRTRPKFFTGFTLVVASDLAQSTLHELAGLLARANVPLLLAQSYGMIGYLRLQAPLHTVVESQPDNPVVDLRLDCPFPELQAYAAQFDLTNLPDDKHRQVPWLLLLLHALAVWKEQHNGAMPRTKEEKAEFKTLLNSGRRASPAKPHYTEENYDEASTNVTKAFMPTRIPSEVAEVFALPQLDNLTRESARFFFLARAVRDFTQQDNGGQLPLKGSLPDMFSDSASYIGLQRVFSERARRDADAVTARVHQLLADVDLMSDTIKDSEIRLFCKNATNLRVLQYRSVAQEHSNNEQASQAVGTCYECGQDTVNWYVLLRAAMQFRQTHGRYPGQLTSEDDAQLASDTQVLLEDANSILAAMQLQHTVPEDYAAEMCRYGAAELHSVAAVMGGIGAQEAVKVLTRQFVPLNNTLVYNGIQNSSLVLRA
eukprot:comp23764_c0_seq1/m.41152 comp23764_c0_seq1/g.41152  ORF comp23764_c0_seq1/g.41152 comp23764_c0_seq1/m.41152 type:complete len:535 (-) comp23764_c0_seq1:146-1750(-)